MIQYFENKDFSRSSFRNVLFFKNLDYKKGSFPFAGGNKNCKSHPSNPHPSCTSVQGSLVHNDEANLLFLKGL